MEINDMQTSQQNENEILFHFENYILYNTFFLLNNKKIAFENIFCLNYHSSSENLGGLSTTRKISLAICISENDKISLYPEDYEELVIVNKTFIPIIQNKQIEVINNFFKILESKTFKFRLNRYFMAIKSKGFFNYIGAAEIYNNGDLKKRNGTIINIKDANENKLVSYGTDFRGLRSSSFDPFAFTIYSSKGIKIKILGFDLNKKFEVQATWNRDCFELIIANIIEKGKCFDI